LINIDDNDLGDYPDDFDIADILKSIEESEADRVKAVA
jgi:hypothetical protein